MEFGDLMLNAMKRICKADRVGSGHGSETPYILMSYSDSPFKYGYKASVTFYIVDGTESDVNIKFAKLQGILSARQLGNFLIRTREYTKPIITKLPDNRWMQEVSVVIIFEEV
jgi:hypothetical protein